MQSVSQEEPITDLLENVELEYKSIVEKGDTYHPVQSSLDSVKLRSIQNQYKQEINENIRITDESVVAELNVDSSAIVQEFESLKTAFQKDLEASLYGLTLTDLSKDDISNRVTNLVKSYQENERFKNALNFDKQLTSKLNAFGENEVATEWLNNKISFAKIFDEYSPKVYTDKVALNQNIAKLKNLSDQKSEIFENWDLDQSSLNEYHKLLQGQINMDEFEENLNSSIGNRNRDKKRKYESLLKKINGIEAEEKQIIEQLKENKYLEYRQKDSGQNLDFLEGYNEKGAFTEDLVFSELNEYVKNEDILDILNNDCVSEYLNKNQPDFSKVGGGVIKQEVIQALDSLDKDWLDNSISTTNNLKKDSKEVEDLLLNDSHTKRLLPKNTYFEGIIGFAKGDFTVFNISPNFGYKFQKGPSVGLGLTLHHTQDENAYIRTALDYKIFGKYEMFKELFFVQTEYIFMIPGMSYLEAEAAGTAEFKNTVLVGGGFSIKIKGKKMLSLGIMYNLDQNMGVPTYDAPLLARLGIKLF